LEGVQDGIGAPIGEETVNVGALAATVKGKFEGIFANPVQGVGRIGTKVGRSRLVPIFIAIVILTVVVKIVDAALGPSTSVYPYVECRKLVQVLQDIGGIFPVHFEMIVGIGSPRIHIVIFVVAVVVTLRGRVAEGDPGREY